MTAKTCRRKAFHVRWKKVWELPTERAERCLSCGTIRRTKLPSGEVSYVFPSEEKHG